MHHYSVLDARPTASVDRAVAGHRVGRVRKNSLAGVDPHVGHADVTMGGTASTGRRAWMAVIGVVGGGAVARGRGSGGSERRPLLRE
jgi:hypothetical protein